MISIKSEYFNLFKNSFYLLALKGLTLIVPILVFPYLIDVIGVKKYGLVMWFWAIAEIYVVIVKFGFDMLGVRMVSRHRNRKAKLSLIVSQITTIKNLIFLMCGISFVLGYFYVPTFQKHNIIFFSFIVFIYFEGMLPVWYFQGIENIKLMAVLLSSVKTVFAVLIFIVVKTEEDYIWVPLLYVSSSFLSNVMAYYVIFFIDNIRLYRVKFQSILRLQKECLLVLLSTFGSVMRDRLTIILVERVVGLDAVAYFDLAIRLVNVLLTPFHVITSVLYPYISRSRDVAFFKKSLIFIFPTSIILVFFVVFYLEDLLRLLSIQDNDDLHLIIMVVIFIVPIGFISSMFGTNFHVVFDNTHYFTISILGAGGIYAIFLSYVGLFEILNTEYFAFAYLLYFFTEMMFLVGFAYKVKRKGL